MPNEKSKKIMIKEKKEDFSLFLFHLETENERVHN